MSSKSATLGSKELQQLQETMRLVVKLLKLAKDSGVKLDKNEEDYLIRGLQSIHNLIYRP